MPFSWKRETTRLLAPLGEQAAASLWGATALVLMLIWLFAGSAGFFAARLAPAGWDAGRVEYWAVIYQFATAFLLWLLVPLLLRRPLRLGRLDELGLGAGDVKAGLVVVLLGVLLVSIPGGLSAGELADFHTEYPLAKSATSSLHAFMVYELAYGLLYYTAWEAFFRGFLQLGLSRHIGPAAAILVQATASTLMHIGKPVGEVWAALAAGFLFGVLVLRTRSVWPLVIVHWALGLATDLACARAAGLGIFS